MADSRDNAVCTGTFPETCYKAGNDPVGLTSVTVKSAVIDDKNTQHNVRGAFQIDLLLIREVLKEEKYLNLPKMTEG